MAIIAEKEIEVRYAETDQMGVVYHANYVIWMEIGRTALIQALGFNYAALEEEGYLSPVLDIAVTYRQPVTFGETVSVRTWVQSHGRVRTVYGYEIVRQDGIVACKATSTHALVEKETFRPVSLSKIDPAWDKAYRVNVCEG